MRLPCSGNRHRLPSDRTLEDGSRMTPFRSILPFIAACVFGLLLVASAAEPDTLRKGADFNGVFHPQDSLGYALETNYFATTNRLARYNPANDTLLIGPYASPANPVGLSWNTNSIFTGRRGVTAISIAQFGATCNRLCLVTRRHAVGLAHYGGMTNGLPVFFMGTNNTLHPMITSNVWSAFGSTNAADEDLEVITFTQDVPDDVQPARVAGPLTNSWRFLSSFFPPPPAVNRQFAVCQHGYVGMCGQPHPGGAVCGQGGDSGSTGFIILGNELLYTGVFSSKPSPFMQQKINELTLSLGLRTNDYQMKVVNLTNFHRGEELK